MSKKKPSQAPLLALDKDILDAVRTALEQGWDGVLKHAPASMFRGGYPPIVIETFASAIRHSHPFKFKRQPESTFKSIVQQCYDHLVRTGIRAEASQRENATGGSRSTQQQTKRTKLSDMVQLETRTGETRKASGKPRGPFDDDTDSDAEDEEQNEDQRGSRGRFADDSDAEANAGVEYGQGEEDEGDESSSDAMMPGSKARTKSIRLNQDMDNIMSVAAAAAAQSSGKFKKFIDVQQLQTRNSGLNVAAQLQARVSAAAGMMNQSMRDLYSRNASISEEGGASTVPSSPTPESTALSLPSPAPSMRAVASTPLNLSRSPSEAKTSGGRVSRTGTGFPLGARKGGPGDGGAAPPRGLPDATSFICPPPELGFSDLGGIEPILQDIRELIEYPLTHPEIYHHLGVPPPRGILLHGPPGCGKTALAHAIAGELKVPFLKISAPEIVGGMSGESEAKIRAIFAEAQRVAPCIVFFDELDAIAPKRSDAQREMERRIVAQLLTCMDSLGQPQQQQPPASQAERRKQALLKEIEAAIPQLDPAESGIMEESTQTSGKFENKTVLVIGATNRPESIDGALRRAGRFDREIALGIPDEAARARILKVLCRNMRLDPAIDLAELSKKTVGYVGADLLALTREAAVIAVNRIFQEISLQEEGEVAPTAEESMKLTRSERIARDLENRERSSRRLRSQTEPLTPEQLERLYITQEDFVQATTKVQPTAKREGFATVPETSWDDVGALEDLEEELDMSIVQPILNPGLFESIGLTIPAGVLLWGPPGCGKTLIGKCVANRAAASFMSVKGPELLNQYVGQSEFAVRQVFERARQSAPCIIFFDEIDALVPKRGTGMNQASERVVNQFLTELDGVDDRRNVFVIAATNRPDIIDPAMLRPGRLDKLLYVRLPDCDGRLAILKKHVRRSPLADDVDLFAIASDPRAEGMSGADMSAMVREASIQALREAQQKMREKYKTATDYAKAASGGERPTVLIEQRHFMFAFTKVRASVSEESRKRYERLHQKLMNFKPQLEKSDAVEVIEETSDSMGTSTSTTPGTGAAMEGTDSNQM